MSTDLIYVSALREFFAEGQDQFLESISHKAIYFYFFIKPIFLANYYIVSESSFFEL